MYSTFDLVNQYFQKHVTILQNRMSCAKQRNSVGITTMLVTQFKTATQ